jgi:hypothetical protein
MGLHVEEERVPVTLHPGVKASVARSNVLKLREEEGFRKMIEDEAGEGADLDFMDREEHRTRVMLAASRLVEHSLL